MGDSWFASVKAAIELHKRGLFFLGIVKTATRNYPIDEAKTRCPEERGKCAIATATNAEHNVKLTCLAWRDKKVHTFVGTCSTTLEGEPAKKKRTDETGRPIIKEVPRPKLVEEYFDGAPAIDIHNHIRQSGLALEVAWNTQKWHHRMFASLFGIIEANAYLALRYFKRDFSMKHSEFTEALALQLIKNPWIDRNPLPLGDEVADPVPVLPLPPQQEWLPGEHVLIPLSKDDDRQSAKDRKSVV